MARLEFETHIYDGNDNDEFYGIANPVNVLGTGKENLVGKFFIAPEDDSGVKQLYYKKRIIADVAHDQTKIDWSQKKGKDETFPIKVKNQLINQHAVDYRVKNFLHYGTYGFVTFGNKEHGPSVLLFKMMGEQTSVKNPDYGSGIDMDPIVIPPYIPDPIPPSDKPTDLIVIDDVLFITGKVTDLTQVIPQIKDNNLIVSHDTIVLDDDTVVIDEDMVICNDTIVLDDDAVVIDEDMIISGDTQVEDGRKPEDDSVKEYIYDNDVYLI